MHVNRIFLDLDDTLNSLTLPALREVGCPVGDFDYQCYPEEAGYSITAAAQLLSGRHWTVPDFWNSIDRNFWRTLPRSKEFSYLLTKCVSLVGQDNVHILTSPTKDPDCLAGKLEWIQQQLPNWLHRQYSITPRKHVCARPGALLIDDSDENVRQFREHGGTAITVPRPWNSFAAVDTMFHLKFCLNSLSLETACA